VQTVLSSLGRETCDHDYYRLWQCAGLTAGLDTTVTSHALEGSRLLVGVKIDHC